MKWRVVMMNGKFSCAWQPQAHVAQGGWWFGVAGGPKVPSST